MSGKKVKDRRKDVEWNSVASRDTIWLNSPFSSLTKGVVSKFSETAGLRDLEITFWIKAVYKATFSYSNSQVMVQLRFVWENHEVVHHNVEIATSSAKNIKIATVEYSIASTQFYLSIIFFVFFFFLDRQNGHRDKWFEYNSRWRHIATNGKYVNFFFVNDENSKEYGWSDIWKVIRVVGNFVN